MRQGDYVINYCHGLRNTVPLRMPFQARSESFQFDPLLAVELREAAILLGIAGLQAACEKVLGSFEERVRKVPIRLDEVLERNKAGSGSVGRRGETLLLMDGMVRRGRELISEAYSAHLKV